jgi:hypothetical protein
LLPLPLLRRLAARRVIRTCRRFGVRSSAKIAGNRKQLAT